MNLRVLCFIILHLNVIEATENVHLFMKDYVLSRNPVPKAVAYLCWKPEDSICLTKLFWSENLFISIKNTFDGLNISNYENTFILDLSCPFAEKVLNEAENKNLFRKGKEWLLLDKSLSQNIYNEEIFFIFNTNSRLTKNFENEKDSHFENKSILIDSNVLYAFQKNFQNIILEKVYRQKPNLDLIWEPFGVWNVNKGIDNAKINKIASRRRQNVAKTPISAYVVVTNNDTLNHLEDFKEKEVDTVIKTTFIILTHLLEFMNATPVYVFGNSWGYKKTDGSYDGMMGAIISKEVDLAGSVLLYSEDRFKYVEFLAETTTTSAAFLFRQPPLSTVYNIFIITFSKLVWVGIGILIIISTLVLYFIFNWEKKRHGTMNVIRSRHSPNGFADSILVAIEAISQQGTAIEASSLSGRIAILVMFTSLMFLYTSYSANIVALIQSNSKSITNFAEFANSKIKCASQDTLYNRFFMPLERDPVKKEIWEKKMVTKNGINFIPLSEGIDRVRKGFFAYHVELGVGYKIIEDTFKENEKCGITSLQFLNLPSPQFSCPKNSQFSEILKIGLIKIQESGIQKRINNKLYTKKPICSGKGSNFVSVGLDEMKEPLIWLFSGIVIALVLLIIENIAYKRSTMG